MTQAQIIIEKFGGMSAMAKALGHKYPTTVQGWKLSGNIPHWRWHEIKAAAKREKIDLPSEATQ